MRTVQTGKNRWVKHILLISVGQMSQSNIHSIFRPDIPRFTRLKENRNIIRVRNRCSIIAIAWHCSGRLFQCYCLALLRKIVLLLLYSTVLEDCFSAIVWYCSGRLFQCYCMALIWMTEFNNQVSFSSFTNSYCQQSVVQRTECIVVFTEACYICTFWPDRFNFSKRAHSQIHFVVQISSNLFMLQTKSRTLVICCF